MRHRVTAQTRPLIRQYLAVALAVGIVSAFATATQQRAAGQEGRVNRNVEELLHKAKELHEAGKQEQAAELRNKAEQLLARARDVGQESEKRRESRGRGEGEAAELREILKGLEQGMASLRALRRMDELERLEKVAASVRRELEGTKRQRGGNDERAVAMRQLEIMKWAVKALKEGEKLDAVDVLQRAIRAREISLEGRRDEEAQAIRNRAPKPGAQAEILGVAAGIWRELGNAERAEITGELAKQLANREGRDRPAAREGRREGGSEERAVAERQMEVMKLAIPALQEAKRGDTIELLQAAIRARRVTLEGRQDEEAQAFRKQAPTVGAQSEIVGYAARLWREYGNADKAEALAALQKQLLAQHQRQREEKPAPRERENRGGNKEREVAFEQLKVMRLALIALREGEKRDSAEMMALAIRSLEMRLEGIRGEEAQAVINRAPKREQTATILGLASQLWSEFGDAEKAAVVAKLAEQFAGRGRERSERSGERESKERPKGGGNKEREVAFEQLKVMRLAHVALREGEKRDSAEMMALAIRSLEMRLEGIRGEEAQAVINRAPKREQTAEILGLASRLWREFGDAENAAVVAKLAEQFAWRGRERNERERSGERESKERPKGGGEREEGARRD